MSKRRSIDLYRELFKVQSIFQYIKNQCIARGVFRKSLYLPKSGLYGQFYFRFLVIKEVNDVVFFTRFQFLSDGGFALVNGADALPGNYADFFRRKFGAKQATELNFSVVQNRTVVLK